MGYTPSGTYAPQNLTGTYAARPAANSVSAGTVYYATDAQELSRSDGSAWSPWGPGGAELGYAETTANQTITGPGPTVITGLTVTVTGGDRPLRVEAMCLMQNTSTPGAPDTVIQLFRGASEIAEAHVHPTTTTEYDTVYVAARVSPLTGAPATFTLKSQGNSVVCFASAGTFKPFLRVATL